MRNRMVFIEEYVSDGHQNNYNNDPHPPRDLSNKNPNIVHRKSAFSQRYWIE